MFHLSNNQPMTRITTSPTRVYRERVSPVRIITPSARIYRRDVTSPVKLIQSPARVMSIRVRPSTLSREFDRIERKFRGSPVRDIDSYVNKNNSYVNVIDCLFILTIDNSMVKNTTFLFDLRVSTMKHVKFVQLREDCWVTFTNQLNALQVSPGPELQVFELRACNHRTTTTASNYREICYKVERMKSENLIFQSKDSTLQNTRIDISTMNIMPAKISWCQQEKHAIRSKSCPNTSSGNQPNATAVSQLSLTEVDYQIRSNNTNLPANLSNENFFETIMKNIWNHFLFTHNTHKTHYTQKLPDKLLVIEGKIMLKNEIKNSNKRIDRFLWCFMFHLMIH